MSARAERELSLAPPRWHKLGLEVLVLVLTLTAALLIGGNSGLSDGERLDQLAWLSLLSLISQVAVLRSVFGSVMSPPVAYSVLLSLFTSSWLTMRVFRLRFEGVDVVGRLPEGSIADAAFFYICSFGFYCLGVVMMGMRQEAARPSRRNSPAIPIAHEQGALGRVGWGCIVLGLIPFSAVTINNFRVVFSGGYGAYYESGARLDNPLTALAYFFLVGLVLVACSGGHKRARRACLALAAIGLLRLLAGDRGEGMILALAALMLWRALCLAHGRAPAGRRSLLLYCAAAVILIPAIGILRQSFGAGELDVRAAFMEQNPLVGTLQTMGGTIFPLVQVIDLVPTHQEFTDGGTYLSGLLRLLPEAVVPSSLTAIVQDPLYASPATWLMQRLGMTYGPGFTPFAEAYLNFGPVGGCIAMTGFGIFNALLLRVPSDASASRIAFVGAFFTLCGFSVRGSSNFLIPALVRFVVLPLFIARLLARSSGSSHR